MKYVYFLNNKALMDLNIKVDYLDIIIFEFMHSFSKYEKCDRIEYEGNVYFWISHNQIIGNIISDIDSKQGIIKRINNLVKANLIKKHPNCRQLRRSYYTFTPLALQYFHLSTVKPKEEDQNDSIPDGHRSLSATDRDHYPERIKDYNDEDYNDEVIMNKKTKQTKLFPDQEDKELRFEVSPANNLEFIKKELKDAVDAGVNVEYYFQAVSDWADTVPSRSSKGRRTVRGWVATVRTFIRRAKTDGKLEMIINPETGNTAAEEDLIAEEMRIKEMMEE